MYSDDLKRLAQECGFDHVGELNVSSLEFLPQVREMCAEDRCHSYNKYWTCPPACGELEQIERRCKAYTQGILFQTTGQLEDEFDAEGIEKTEKRHQRNFYKFVNQALKVCPSALAMGVGACRLCKECTWPHSPCRHPELAFPSMEACGLFVSRVCEMFKMKYYYGRNTITFTSCMLF